MDQAMATAVRTLLVSDVHLGCKHSRSDAFLTFLRQYVPETLYIVGDFIDTWKINSGWHWPSSCDQVIDHLAGLARSDTRILYVPGNHDSFLRNASLRGMLPSQFPPIEIANEFIFETLSGRRLLVTHGDLFDFFETKAQWISKGTSVLYDACLSMNWWVHRFAMTEQRNPYGACATLKNRVKRGVKFISRYEQKITHHAQARSCHGVVCGHIHTPEIMRSGSMLYCNTGDWVENCTGVVEHYDGRLSLVSRYAAERSLTLPPTEAKTSETDLPTLPSLDSKDQDHCQHNGSRAAVFETDKEHAA